ncbi:hypothetical protein FF124_16545 [Martelella lutilitoris]|uniref:Uncharacterized protein n=1 Tax=Martelella lutilitoris TaxID=2583532 RepID=A0A5C4JMC3_9HYPH|nr:hypothetical protein [Martelella lutilitoris]TNB46605.1 hypothetical protein FF124_16545 [Martelella lutilitoris]
MTRRPARLFSSAMIAAALVAALPANAAAESADSAFFRMVAGKWSGPGKIVEGKMKGTRFRCELDGLPIEGEKDGFKLDGKCRAGLFSHPMTAVFIREADGYRGRFLDGEDGDGLEVTGGSVENGKAVIELRREDVEGALVTSLKGPEDLNITLLIKGGTRYVPVIGLSLKRQTDPLSVGSID